jgi:hypothetical protein
MAVAGSVDGQLATVGTGTVQDIRMAWLGLIPVLNKCKFSTG